MSRHDIELFKSLDSSEQNTSLLVNPSDAFSNNEYISMYHGIIVYRDCNNTLVYRAIDKIQTHSRYRLVLVKQRGMLLQFVWVNGVPNEYIVKRSRIPQIKIDNTLFQIVGSVTIMEEG